MRLLNLFSDGRRSRVRLRESCPQTCKSFTRVFSEGSYSSTNVLNESSVSCMHEESIESTDESNEDRNGKKSQRSQGSLPSLENRISGCRHDTRKYVSSDSLIKRNRLIHKKQQQKTFKNELKGNEKLVKNDGSSCFLLDNYNSSDERMLSTHCNTDDPKVNDSKTLGAFKRFSRKMSLHLPKKKVSFSSTRDSSNSSEKFPVRKQGNSLDYDNLTNVYENDVSFSEIGNGSRFDNYRKKCTSYEANYDNFLFDLNDSSSSSDSSFGCMFLTSYTDDYDRETNSSTPIEITPAPSPPNSLSQSAGTWTPSSHPDLGDSGHSDGCIHHSISTFGSNLSLSSSTSSTSTLRNDLHNDTFLKYLLLHDSNRIENHKEWSQQENENYPRKNNLLSRDSLSTQESQGFAKTSIDKHSYVTRCAYCNELVTVQDLKDHSLECSGSKIFGDSTKKNVDEVLNLRSRVRPCTPSSSNDTDEVSSSVVAL